MNIRESSLTILTCVIYSEWYLIVTYDAPSFLWKYVELLSYVESFLLSEWSSSVWDAHDHHAIWISCVYYCWFLFKNSFKRRQLTLRFIKCRLWQQTKTPPCQYGKNTLHRQLHTWLLVSTVDSRLKTTDRTKIRATQEDAFDCHIQTMKRTSPYPTSTSTYVTRAFWRTCQISLLTWSTDVSCARRR